MCIIRRRKNGLTVDTGRILHYNEITTVSGGCRGGKCMNRDREKYILERLLKKKRVTVKELAAELYASEPSIRRDLLRLEKQNLVRRVHGGAILEEHSESLTKIPYVIREIEDRDAKSIIAAKAAALVQDGDVIMLDASSTACAMIPYLSGKSNLTVITNGLKTLIKLGEYGINAYSTGGHLAPSCMSLVESDAGCMIEKNNADIAFFSCRGLSPEGFLTDFFIEENIVRREMIRRAQKSVLLCASEKFNKTYMHNLCSIHDIDRVISEVEFSESLLGG